YPWFERIPTLEHYRNYTIPKEVVRVKRWWDAVSDRPAVKAIANPVDFYIERYSRFIQQPVAA
ncbi:MAG: glutathione S-transferase family protein, partial [Pseudanabaena sp.]